jgi:hypothetical protein
MYTYIYSVANTSRELSETSKKGSARVTFESQWTAETAAFTDVYYKNISTKDHDLTTHEKLEGWMTSYLPNGQWIRKKGWDINHMAPHDRDAKYTWEVIQVRHCLTVLLGLLLTMMLAVCTVCYSNGAT